MFTNLLLWNFILHYPHHKEPGINPSARHLNPIQRNRYVSHQDYACHISARHYLGAGCRLWV